MDRYSGSMWTIDIWIICAIPIACTASGYGRGLFPVYNVSRDWLFDIDVIKISIFHFSVPSLATKNILNCSISGSIVTTSGLIMTLIIKSGSGQNWIGNGSILWFNDLTWTIDVAEPEVSTGSSSVLQIPKQSRRYYHLRSTCRNEHASLATLSAFLASL